MRKLLLILMAAVAVTAGAKNIQRLVLTTEPPMHCQNCENRIKSNVRFTKGVKKIETSVPDQRVTITYDADKTNPKKIADAFADIDYTVTVIDSVK